MIEDIYVYKNVVENNLVDIFRDNINNTLITLLHINDKQTAIYRMNDSRMLIY